MPEAVVAPAAPAAPVTPPPVSPADAQRALIARENGVTYSAESQTFSEPAAPAEGGTTPEAPASGEPAQNQPANSEAQGEQADTPVDGGGDENDPDGTSASPQTEQEQPPGKNHVARKIDKLTRENAQLARVVQQLIARQQAPVNGNQPPNQPQQPQDADPKPDPAKYTDVAQYIADTAAWTSRQETQKTVGALFGHLAQQAAHQQQLHAAAQQVQEFNDKVTQGAAEFKDFKQVTTANADVEVAPHVAASIMQGVDNPAAVLYHLAKNPGEVAKLNAMHPAKVAVRLGAIEANAKRTPAISNAPKPGTPVSARGSVPTEYSDDMSTEAFMQMRARQTRK